MEWFTKKLKANRGFRFKYRAWVNGIRRCEYCSCQLHWNRNSPNYVTLDHMVCKKHGAGIGWGNFLIVCESCNTERGSTPFLEWIIQKRFSNRDYLVTRYLETLKNLRDINAMIKIDIKAELKKARLIIHEQNS